MGGEGGILSLLIPIILMVVIFYFLLIRPQQKRQKQVRHMQSELQKGNKVVTIGGFHATIQALEENTVILQSDEGTNLTYDRNAIREVKNES